MIFAGTGGIEHTVYVLFEIGSDPLTIISVYSTFFVLIQGADMSTMFVVLHWRIQLIDYVNFNLAAVREKCSKVYYTILY